VTPILLSLSVGLAATLLSLVPAVALARWLSRGSGRGRGAVQVLVTLPLVLPPVVTGWLLLRAFSPRGPLGRALEGLGAPVAFHWTGAVLAAAVVGFPLFVAQVSLALGAVEPRLEVAARSLGLPPFRAFLRATLPLAWPGILAGALLSFARGLGEFGATIVLAGRIPGETETIPLRIYAELERPGGEGAAAVLVAASVGICVACVLGARNLERRHRARLEMAA
jgi:molybdate transport system permease protein